MSNIGQAEIAVKLGGANMTDNAASGIAAPVESILTGASVGRDMIVALALKASETKKGGASFKTSVLVDKVRHQVRSRLGLDAKQLVPADVNTVICEVCQAIVTEFNRNLAKRGFEAERASGERNRIKGKEGSEALDKVLTVTHSRPLTLREQITAAHAELNTIHDKLALLDQGMTPNRKPDTRLPEVRQKAKEGMEARAGKLAAVIANAEREIGRIAELARANGV